MAAMAFNKFFESNVRQYGEWNDYDSLYTIYQNAFNNGVMFDARCFNIPKEEVCNLIYWRQLDATRNSIQMVGQANFPHKELQGKSCNMIQDMLMEQKGINWNDYPTACKRGSACIKDDSGWRVDLEMPILRNEDRAYVNKQILFDEN